MPGQGYLPGIRLPAEGDYGEDFDAKPPDEQTARIQMYDPIRRMIPDYFKSGRDSAVLDQVTAQLDEKRFDNPIFDEKWHKANRAAIENLLSIKLNGTFENIQSATERHS